MPSNQSGDRQRRADDRVVHHLDDLIRRFAIPTQSCVLTHVTNP